MLVGPLWEIEPLWRGPEIGAVTRGLLLLASKAGDGEETLQFQYCEKVPYPPGGLSTTDSNVSPRVRLDLGLLSSLHREYAFQRLWKIIHVNIPKNMSRQPTRLRIQKM